MTTIFKITLTTFLALLSWQLMAQETPLWMRYPSVSPDGKQIVFGYKGDLYTVPAEGGTATPLTLHDAYDSRPVWSVDAKHIAFSSNRYGNFDVFIMSASGGAPTRLTYHSANDYPTDFTRDNQSVIFSSLRLDDADNRMFPSTRLPELYLIPREGGRPYQYLTIPAEDATFNKDGSLLAFHDKKGYEDEYRKHHTSSVTRNIWIYDIDNDNYTQITNFKGEDRDPLFAADGKTIYYLSEESGSYNVHAIGTDQGETIPESKQLTRLKKHPVRNLTMSSTGLMCFSYNGEIYTMRDGKRPEKVEIQIAVDRRYNPEKIVKARKANEMDVSPNGKEVLYVNRGEVFVSSIESGVTKRITNTPEMERSASFSPDGRSILYASERDNSWNLYQTKLAREDEKYFFNSTILEEDVILENENETFQPAWSPDGKEVAYLSERTELKVINLESKELRTIVPGDKNYSYSDGDQYYQWSPDGKWFLVNYLQDQQWIEEVGLVKATGEEEPINLTQSGYADHQPKWMMDGKMLIYFSGRDGMTNQASWGGQLDVYGMYLTDDAWDRSRMTKEEYKLFKEEEKERKKKKKKKKKDDKKEEKKDDGDDENEDDKKEDKKDKKDEDEDEDGEDKEDKKDEIKLEPITIELDGIRDRKKRLTIHSSSLSDAVISKDGEKLYYLSSFEKGYDLWVTNLRTRSTKIMMKLKARGGGIQLSKDGKFLFVLNGGSIMRIQLNNKKRKGISLKGEMVLRESEERAYLFEHAWRQVVKKFYREDLHDVDWDFYKEEYQRFLPHINNGYDFSDMMSELLGELNASHTGCRFRGNRSSGSDATASLGFYYDHSHELNGLKIKEVMPKNPIVDGDSKIKEGVIIEAINGIEIDFNTNHNKLLNRKAGKYTLLTLFDPDTGDRWDETVKPFSRRKEFDLRYDRWVNNCRELTEKVSNGRIGYVHVKGMNNSSYKTVYEEVLGRNAGKEAIIVDTRFNGGGWLHDDLATFLSGQVYLRIRPRGQDLGKEPMFKWNKPSAVLMGEGNYSDAHMFPYTYKALDIGKLIGMPVPGTATAVWWERLPGGYVFGIPQVGMVTNDGEYLENTQLEPDVKVRNDLKSVSTGEDLQIEAAVKELFKELDSKDK